MNLLCLKLLESSILGVFGSGYSIALHYENIFRQFDDIDRFIFLGFLKGGTQYSGSQERAVLRKAFQIEKFRIMHSSHSSHIPLI